MFCEDKEGVIKISVGERSFEGRMCLGRHILEVTKSVKKY